MTRTSCDHIWKDKAVEHSWVRICMLPECGKVEQIRGPKAKPLAELIIAAQNKEMRDLEVPDPAKSKGVLSWFRKQDP